MLGGIKMRQDGQHSQQVADEVAAGIAEKRARAGKIVRQKPEQRAKGQKGDQRHQILAASGGDRGEVPGADGPQPRAKAVHVIDKIEGVDDRQYPEDRDGVAEEEAVDKEGDARARGDHEQGHGQLTAKLGCRRELAFVIQPADGQHSQRSQEYPR